MKKRQGEARPGKKVRGNTETRGRGDKAPRHRVSASASQTAPQRSSIISPALITLLTDFGSSDYFIGAMKGVILSINRAAQIIDITHDTAPQDISAAAFTLLAAYPSFPAGTIHVAVVDPGVGSSRRPLAVAAAGHLFVGPDNGIFSHVIERALGAGVFHITAEKHFRQPVSSTFHGRDVFAPVAAALSKGVTPEQLGSAIKDYVRLAPLAAEKSVKGDVRGRIIHIDHFGNLITNFTQNELTPEMIKRGVRLSLNGKTIKDFRDYFLEEKEGDDKLFAIWGSAGFLEIAAKNRSAAKLLKARRDQSVYLFCKRRAE